MSYLGYYLSETKQKLDQLQAVVERCIESEGMISIPEMARELNLSRQGITYRLKLLERDRGVKIPDDRRFPQSRAPRKASVVPPEAPVEPSQIESLPKRRKSILGLPRASLGKWYMQNVFGDDDTGEYVIPKLEEIE